jgi:general secretion pathway protein D
MISVLIAGVTLNDTVDLGVEFAGQDLHFSENATVGPNGVIQGEDYDWVSGTDLGAAGLGLGGFNFTITGEDFSFLFRALQQDNRLEILSRPILLVRNGEEGKITIADQVPIVESTNLSDTGQTQSTIGREDVGIILTATPHISPDGYVTIELKQEISNIGGTVQLTEGVSSPIFQTREVETNVTLRDSETIVIGGLIQTEDSDSENKVPILGDIPGLGFLFRTISVGSRKTELLVVLTVDILRTDEDLHQMSVEQRDKFLLPDSIRQSPLMEGLRITPQEQALGPKPAATSTRPVAPHAPAGEPRKEPRDSYGPKPKTYGPTISKPASTDKMTAPVYGPKVARSEAAGKS